MIEIRRALFILCVVFLFFTCPLVLDIEQQLQAFEPVLEEQNEEKKERKIKIFWLITRQFWIGKSILMLNCHVMLSLSRSDGWKERTNEKQQKKKKERGDGDGAPGAAEKEFNFISQ
jgi:hypothetical protein